MQQLIQNPTYFISYQLTEAQQLTGLTFTPLQRAVLQNLLHIAATRKVHLTLNPEAVVSYAQEEAAIAAEILQLTYLLGAQEAIEDSADSQGECSDS